MRVAVSRGTGPGDHPVPRDVGAEEPAVLKEKDDHFIGRRFQQLDCGERVRLDRWATVLRNIHDKQSRCRCFGLG